MLCLGLITFSLFGQTAAGDDQTSKKPLPVVLSSEVFVLYGGAQQVFFDFDCTALPDIHLPQCATLRLVAIARNPRENFERTASEAHLELDPICFECAEGDGEALRVTGRIDGPALRGEHQHLHMLDSPDRFGLFVDSGAPGEARLEIEEERSESCFRRQP